MLKDPLFVSISFFVFGMAREIMEGCTYTKRAFTFHCVGKSCKTCNRVGLLGPCTYPKLRWEVETRETCTRPVSEAGGGAMGPPVLAPVPQQAYHSSPSSLLRCKKNNFACGQLFRFEHCHHRIHRGEQLGERNTSPSNNLLLDLRHWEPCTPVQETPQK